MTMENILSYIRRNWILLAFGFSFLLWYVYLSYSGNQLCDCEKTEKYQEGNARSSSGGRTFYRYYHK